MEKGPKLNLIKEFEERGGGGGNPSTLTVSSLVSEFLTKKLNLTFFFFLWRGGGGGGGPGTETKTVWQTVSNEVNTKMQLSTQC